MDQSIFRNDDQIIEALIHLVFVNEKGKPIKIDNDIIEKLKPYFK